MTGGMLLGGCVRRIPTNGLMPPKLELPLTIDVHCHFFNASDLQMQSFIENVVNADRQHRGEARLAPAAQGLAWRVAPKAKSEMKRLQKESINNEEAQKKREQTIADAYNKFRQQVAKASPDEARDLPKHYKDYIATHPVGGPWPTFKEYFQYRYVALADYLDLYEQTSDRSLDLMIAHLVDYDWPLNHGRPTPSHLTDQIKLMQRISVLTNGRVHTFAPFDPLREVAYRAGFRRNNWSSLEMVQHWVDQYGCIGVKMYPPMGFAPYGNSRIRPDTWSGMWNWWLPDPTKVKDENGGYATIGERLDSVLAELYHWCLKKDLPVMAHTSLSYGLNRDFDEFPEARHWAELRSEFGGLRVNLGHMGGLEDTTARDWNGAPNSGTLSNVQELIALMSADPSAPGGRFYGDAAYTKRILNERNRKDLFGVYEAALSWKSHDQSRPILKDRLMYGSDWSLLMLEPDMKTYFGDFIEMYTQLDSWMPAPNGPNTALSRKFFGENAVEYLGLRDGPTRQRLIDFYRDRGIAVEGSTRPAWMIKIDS